MKRMNKNIGMRQRVRVLETGQMGTVTDQQLMKRDGVLHRYMQVRLDERPHLDRWFWDDQVGGTKETCRVTLENENGQALVFDIVQDFEKDRMAMKLSGTPGNLKEHNGLACAYGQILCGRHHPARASVVLPHLPPLD